MAKKISDEVKSKIRLRIRAYDHKIIDGSARQIIDAIQRQGGEVI